jgi:hypothetical protein
VVGFTTGSRGEVPGKKRKPVTREYNNNNNNNNNVVKLVVIAKLVKNLSTNHVMPIITTLQNPSTRHNPKPDEANSHRHTLLH